MKSVFLFAKKARHSILTRSANLFAFLLNTLTLKEKDVFHVPKTVRLAKTRTYALLVSQIQLFLSLKKEHLVKNALKTVFLVFTQILEFKSVRPVLKTLNFQKIKSASKTVKRKSL